MNTTTTLYIVKIYCEDATLTVETNSASTMFDHINTALGEDVPCEVICGTTGEVLMSHNCGCGEYATEEFAMLFLEVLMEEAWG